MKIMMFPALIALAMMAACGSQDTQPTPAGDTMTVSDRLGEIAGDKTMMADAMKRSLEKGTFDDALALAMTDSVFAASVVEVVRADPRYAALFAQTSAASRTASTARSSSSSSRRSTAASGDALDKTERAMKQANDKLDQAGRVRDQVDEAKRKAEGILKPR